MGGWRHWRWVGGDIGDGWVGWVGGDWTKQHTTVIMYIIYLVSRTGSIERMQNTHTIKHTSVQEQQTNKQGKHCIFTGKDIPNMEEKVYNNLNMIHIHVTFNYSI